MEDNFDYKKYLTKGYLTENIVDEDEFRFFKITLGDSWSDDKIEQFLKSDEYKKAELELNLDYSDAEEWNGELINYFHGKGKLQENKYDIDDPNSPLGKLNDDYESSGLKGIIDKYGLDVVLMMLSSGEYGKRKSTSSGIEYTSEGKLKTKENQMSETKLTPLQKYIFDYESDISNDVDMKAIKGLKNADDVYDYYAYERGWEDDKDLEDDLNNIYSQVKNKFKEN